MSTKLERFDFSEILRRRLNMPGEAGPRDLAPEVVGCVVLENDRPEWRYLSGEKRGVVAIVQAATALARSTCRIRNPASSNVLAVIERVYIAIGTTAGQVAYRTGEIAADLATVGIVAVSDRRFGDVQLALIGSRDNAPSGLTRGVWHSELAIQSPQAIESPVVLPPGSAVEATTIANNTDLYFSAVVRERSLGSFEL